MIALKNLDRNIKIAAIILFLCLGILQHRTLHLPTAIQAWVLAFLWLTGFIASIAIIRIDMNKKYVAENGGWNNVLASISKWHVWIAGVISVHLVITTVAALCGMSTANPALIITTLLICLGFWVHVMHLYDAQPKIK